MNIKILSLSLLLVITNFINGTTANLTDQERAFINKELDKANKDYDGALEKIRKKLNETKESEELNLKSD